VDVLPPASRPPYARPEAAVNATGNCDTTPMR
jgi:hypothetical protein